MDEFSEKDLAERRVGEHTLSAVGGIVGAQKASSGGQFFPGISFLLLKMLPEDVCILVTSGIGSHLFHKNVA